MAISFEKQASGKVTLTKGEGRVLLRKSAEPLRATASWPPHTDYDVYALLVLRDGSTRAVAMFGAEGQPAQASFGGVRHLGDVGRSTPSGGGGLKGLFRRKPAEQRADDRDRDRGDRPGRRRRGGGAGRVLGAVQRHRLVPALPGEHHGDQRHRLGRRSTPATRTTPTTSTRWCPR